MTNNYKISLVCFVALLTSTLIFAQIPNAGFENWHTAGFPSYNEPDTWGTLNSSTAIITVFTAEKANAANSHSGLYALKLSTHYIAFASQTAPGICASSATINTNNQSIDGGFIFTQRTPALKGWYKGTPAANDSSQIEVSLWKWDNTNHVRIGIGTAKFTTSVTVAAYTQFTLPITYTSALNPDSCLIILSSSNTSHPVDGSVFYVDDLAFVDCSSFTSATPSSTNSTCTAANGSATVTATGATSYHWSNNGSAATISNIAADTYTVTATNIDGCSVSASATVSTTSTAITSTISSTPTTCGASTGTATVTPINGTASYTYHWSNNGSAANISALNAGGYQVTITDANGCSGTATVNVTTPNGPSATQVTTDVTCHGSANGAVNVTTTGGTGTIIYHWNPNASTEDIANLTGGTYNVTISDANNCSFTLSATVNEPITLALSETHTNLLCHGDHSGTIDLTVTGGTPIYTFNWNSGAATTEDLNNLSAAHNSVIVHDAHNCVTNLSIVITEPTVLSLSLTATNASSSTATDGSIGVTPAGGTPPYGLTWSSGSGTNLAPGNYSVTLTDGNNCTATASATVGFTSGVKNVTDSKILVYPNPANNQIVIETGAIENKFSFTVYSVDGKLVNEKTIAGDKVLVDVKQLPVGFYSYQLKDISSGNVSYGKLQIQR